MIKAHNIKRTGSGINRITPSFTINNVIAITTGNSVIAGAAIQRIRTIAANQAVIAAIAQEAFSAIAANDGVIARTAIDNFEIDQPVRAIRAIAGDTVI